MMCLNFVIAIFAVAADGSGSSNAQVARPPSVPTVSAAKAGPISSEATPLFVLSRKTSELLQSEASAKSSAGRAAAIQELCELHQTLRTDRRYEQVGKLQDLRGRVYSRLRRVQTDLRQKLDDEPASKAAGVKNAVADKQLEAASEGAAALAASDTLAASLLLADRSIGGPAALLNFGGGAVRDNGQALVDLIERTINPAFWDVNGGNGTIVYYAPLQCLVVRASGETHHRIGGLLGDVRAAGQ